MDCKGQTRLYASFLRHHVKNHIFEIIEECDKDMLNERERCWQDYYDVIGRNGLNCCLTKSKQKRYIASEETRRKISEKISGENHYMFGKKKSDDIKKKISESMKGDKCYRYGKKISPHVIKKTIETKKNKYGDNLNSWSRIKVITVDDMIIFDSLKQAANHLNLSHSFVSACISGKKLNKIGVAKYDDFLLNKDTILKSIAIDRLKDKKLGNNGNSKKIINSLTGEIYGTIKEAAISMGISVGSMYVLKSRKKLPEGLRIVL